MHHASDYGLLIPLALQCLLGILHWQNSLGLYVRIWLKPMCTSPVESLPLNRKTQTRALKNKGKLPLYTIRSNIRDKLRKRRAIHWRNKKEMLKKRKVQGVCSVGSLALSVGLTSRKDSHSLGEHGRNNEMSFSTNQRCIVCDQPWRQLQLDQWVIQRIREWPTVKETWRGNIRQRMGQNLMKITLLPSLLPLPHLRRPWSILRGQILLFLLLF